MEILKATLNTIGIEPVQREPSRGDDRSTTTANGNEKPALEKNGSRPASPPPQPKLQRMTTSTKKVRLGSGQLTGDTMVHTPISDMPPRTVGDLRPKSGVVVTPNMTVAECAKTLATARQDACLVLSSAEKGEDGHLEGIVTDVDVVRKVLSEGLEPEEVLVRQVMTANPLCVKSETTTAEALNTMLSKRCRHLPVIDAEGHVGGLLDISKLLFDVMAAAQAGGARSGATRTLSELFDDPSVMKMGGAVGSGAAPTQRVMQAAVLMCERRSAVLVAGSETKRVAGILTPKDVLFRAVAAGLPTATVKVADVMTEAPDVMENSATVMQALHQLSTGGYRSVPVVDDEEKPCGVLDVLALVFAALNTPASSSSAPSTPRSTAVTPLSTAAVRTPTAAPPLTAPSDLTLGVASVATMGIIALAARSPALAAKVAAAKQALTSVSPSISSVLASASSSVSSALASVAATLASVKLDLAKAIERFTTLPLNAGSSSAP